MTREELKEIFPFIKAFCEGKTIQGKAHINSDWNIDYGDDLPIGDLWHKSMFRIKPKPTYRPFKNAEECWHEMQKHQPFGWLKRSDSNEYYHYDIVENTICFQQDYEEFIFIDGTPFGIKVEEE